MPVYDFLCTKCNDTFEIQQSISEHESAEVTCPSCGAKEVERRWSRVFAVTSKKS